MQNHFKILEIGDYVQSNYNKKWYGIILDTYLINNGTQQQCTVKPLFTVDGRIIINNKPKLMPSFFLEKINYPKLLQTFKTFKNIP